MRSGLTVKIQLQLIFFDLWIQIGDSHNDLLPYFLEPFDVLLGQVPDRPDVPALNKGENVQGGKCLTVPIKVRSDKKSVDRMALEVDDVFLFSLSVNDVEHPIEAAGITLSSHVRAHLLGVQLGRFGDHAILLRQVFRTMLLSTGIYDVYLEVGRLFRSAGSKKPVIYVIGTQVFEALQSWGQLCQRILVAGERSSLRKKNCRLLVNTA